MGHFPLIVRDLVAGSVQLEQTGLNLHATAGARVFISLTQLPDFITAWNYDRTRLAESLLGPLFFFLRQPSCLIIERLAIFFPLYQTNTALLLHFFFSS